MSVSLQTMRYWMERAIERDLHLSPPQAEEGRAALQQCFALAEASVASAARVDELEAALGAAQDEATHWRNSLAEVASVVNIMWKGEGKPLEAGWIVDHVAQWGKDYDRDVDELESRLTTIAEAVRARACEPCLKRIADTSGERFEMEANQ